MRWLRWVGDDSYFVFRQKLLGEDVSVRRGVVMVKQPGLFSPSLGRCLDPGHKFGCDTVHAQFFRQNPLACPITNSHILSNVVTGPTSILTEELLNSCNSFRSCAASGSPCVFVLVNWCATGLEQGIPLKHPRTIEALIPEGLLNYCEGLRSTFLKTGTNSDAHSLFLSRIHRENRHRSRTRLQINACKNCALPPSYVQLGTLTLYT
jgi:hypothetical protein